MKTTSGGLPVFAPGHCFREAARLRRLGNRAQNKARSIPLKIAFRYDFLELDPDTQGAWAELAYMLKREGWTGKGGAL